MLDTRTDDPLARLRREAEEARRAFLDGLSLVAPSSEEFLRRVDAYGAAREAAGRAEGAKVLRLYGTHLGGCATRFNLTARCDCGLDAAIRALSPAAPDRREG